MIANIIESHIETHRQIMALIRTKVPEKKTFSFGDVYSLKDLIIDEDGSLRADYTLYRGCGQYDNETEYLDPRVLFGDQE